MSIVILLKCAHMYLCIRPQLLVWYLGWWRRRHTVDTTSRRYPLSTANSNADGPCWRFYYLHDVLWMCLCASLPVFPSPCCGGWQSELSTSFCQLIPIDVPACRLSPQGISTGPNSSCRWGSCRWCPSTLGIVRPPSPAVVAQQIHLHSSALCSSAATIPSLCLPHLLLCYTQHTHGDMTVHLLLSSGLIFCFPSFIESSFSFSYEKVLAY
jgi:hypothetical protein